MFFLKKPKNFYPEIDVVICHFFYEDEILLLKIRFIQFSSLILSSNTFTRIINKTIITAIVTHIFNPKFVKIFPTKNQKNYQLETIPMKIFR